MSRDWCKFFADIEANPKAIVQGLTVRDLLLAREHVYNCDTCYMRSERVLAQKPPTTIMDDISKN